MSHDRWAGEPRLVYCVNEYSRQQIKQVVGATGHQYLEFQDEEVYPLKTKYNRDFPSGYEVSLEFSDDLANPNMKQRPVTIVAHVQSHQDIMKVLLANAALRKSNFKHVELWMPYFPYARMDRDMGPGIPVSVQVMANLINSCNFGKVTVYDPHSSAVELLVNNLEVRMPSSWCFHSQQGKAVVLAPDAGAEKRARKFAAGWADVVCASKVRVNNSVCQLAVPHIPDDTDHIIVVDDICDGGATFKHVAGSLHQSTATNRPYNLSLVVTHGLFTGEVQKNLEPYDHVYVTDSCPVPNWSNPKITVIDTQKVWK